MRDIPVNPRSATFFVIFSRLGMQISAHFDNGEKVFKPFGMPLDEVLIHVQAHAAILEQYTKLNLDRMAGKMLSRREVRTPIKQRGIDHVVTRDRGFSSSAQ